KRNEKPGLEVFVRLADDGKGFELIGPAEKLRPLAFPGEASAYDLATLDQQENGARLYMSLVFEPVGGADGSGAPKPARALHIVEVSPAAARATEIGTIPLGDDRGAFAWVAGGDNVAFMRKTMGEGGREIVIYQR